MNQHTKQMILGLMVSVSFLAPLSVNAAKEAELIRILGSDAPKAEKAISCKTLAVSGGGDAARALGALLSDSQLASWARIGLEAIPDAECDAVLRDAAGTLDGTLLVGVINSIGVRRDSGAVDMLVSRLKDPDNEVACAAAAALGRIGGDTAIGALLTLLTHENATLRSAAAYSGILCAERYMNANSSEDAIAIYDKVRQSNVPKARIIEATRGAILARGDAGSDLIPALLVSDEKHLFQIALSTAREMPRLDVSEDFMASLKQLSPARQGLAVRALAQSKDSRVLPAMMNRVKDLSSEAQLAMVASLQSVGSASGLPLLLDYATGADAALSDAAQSALIAMSGEGIDALVLAELGTATQSQQAALLRVAAYRYLEECLPVAEKNVFSPDSDVATSAALALGMLGRSDHVPVLVEMLRAADKRVPARKALMSIATREASRSVAHFLPLLADSSSAVRIDALAFLATAGGPDALRAVVAAVKESDPDVADEAVRALSVWPNNWPNDAGVEEPLLTLAESGNSLKHKVLALRGYVQYLSMTTNLSAEEKAVRVEALMALASRPEEQEMIRALKKELKREGRPKNR